MSLLYAIMGWMAQAGGGGGGNPGFLDSYTTGLQGVFSNQRRLSSYTGALLQVRRSSDNTTQDIGYAEDDSLDETALLAFVGSGDGFVSIWYDQSDGGNNFAQATSSAQPQIVSAGAYLGFLMFDGSNDTFTCVNPHTSTSGLSVFMRGTLNSTASRSIFFATDTGGQGGSPNSSPICLWDYDSSGVQFRDILAAASDADLNIANVPSISLNGNVHTIVTDLTQASAGARVHYYVNGSPPSQSTGVVGSFPTTATFNNAEPWSMASRGGANFASVSMTDMMIYDVVVPSVAAISTIIAYTPP